MSRRHARTRRRLLRNSGATSTPEPRPLGEELRLRDHHDQALPVQPRSELVARWRERGEGPEEHQEPEP